jgi:hypothetical protein
MPALTAISGSWSGERVASWLFAITRTRYPEELFRRLTLMFFSDTYGPEHQSTRDRSGNS